MKPIRLDGRSLSRVQLVEVAHGASVELDAGALENVARAAGFLAGKVERGQPIYGVSTGFGSNADKLLGGDDDSLYAKLQRNLIETHAVCVGEAWRFGAQSFTCDLVMTRTSRLRNDLPAGKNTTPPAAGRPRRPASISPPRRT